MRIPTLAKALFLFFFLYSCPGIAQQEGTVESQGSTSGAQPVVTNVQTGSLGSYNLFDLSGYLIEGKLERQNTYTFNLFRKDNRQESQVTFTLRPLSKEAFILNFFTAFAELEKKLESSEEARALFGKQLPSAIGLGYDISLPAADASRPKDYDRVKEEATKLFYMFVARGIVNDSQDDEPIAGTICYYDNIQILRRDFSGQSANSTMKRLWKAYRTDRRVVKKHLNEGVFDTSLWLNNTSSFDPDAKFTNKTLNGFLGKDLLASNGISGQFSFTELSEQLNRRAFIRKKGNELLRKRASERQAKYEKATDELSESKSELEMLTNNRAQFSKLASNVEELISVEKERAALENALDKALEEVQLNIKKTYGSIEEALEKSLDKSRGLEFGSAASRNALYVQTQSLIDLSARSFIGLAQCECASNDCQELADNLKKTIEQGKSTLRTSLEAENEWLRKSAALAMVDSTGTVESLEEERKKIREKINGNNKILVEILGLYDDIPAKIDAINAAYEKYCGIAANALPALDAQQHKLAREIEPSTYKNWAQLLLTTRLEGTPSQSVMASWEDMKSEIQDSLKVWDEGIVSLGQAVKTQRLNLIRIQDQLIFKDFMVDNIVIEINEGFIENILVTGTVNEYTDKYGKLKFSNEGKAVLSPRTLKFENSSPIGFSRKLDFDALKGIKLYTRGGSKTHYETYLEDIISIYIQAHQVGRRDFSPANQVVVLKKDEDEQSGLCLELKKESTYRLFEARVFSDFVGLDDTEPNGLIQTEVSKQINLLTSRKPFQFFSLAGLRNDWNMGFLSFLEPTVTLSKIEDNNRFLVLNNKDRFINNQYAPIKFASTLSLKQFENFSAGAKANLLLFDMPNLKSTLYLNWGLGYGRTAILEQIRTVSEDGVVQVDSNGVVDYGVNTFTHYPEVMWSIYEDERYGLSFSWRHHWFYLRDNRFEQVADITFFENQVANPTKDSRQFNTIRFLTYLEPSTNNKGRLFFRYTYNWQQGFWRTGFHQAQVGYSFFLLGRQGG